jgi:hypothetical protein
MLYLAMKSEVNLEEIEAPEDIKIIKRPLQKQ